MRAIRGERIARGAEVSLGAAAAVFDDRGRLRLTRRSDNGQLCLPGGRHDAGESLAETCLRELAEETGLTGRVERLIGLYSSPDVIVVYADGIRRQIVAACFEVSVDPSQRAKPVAEVLELRYVSREEVTGLDVLDLHKARITDAFDHLPDVSIR